MSHLPDIGLTQFKRGTGLSAEALNRNFALLLEAIETAMRTALTPDSAAVGNEVAIAGHEDRIARLEHMVTLHARQRNEKEWAPMAHLGAVMQMVLELRGPVSDRADRLLAAQAEARTIHDDLARRIARLEQQPEAATQEDFTALAQDHARLREKEHMLLAQVHAVRAETTALTKMAMGRARQRNEVEYATMAHLGAVVVMVKDIQKLLDEYGIIR